ncbi:MAG: pknB 10 [Deltaproteobacteria bacterium]|nr:pknB 10 [Deltaproteobacteria bacterium]
MGEVYLATDLALDRPVAIKVLPEDVARDPTRRDRLIREARAQARISHPNVAHIYFVGEEAGRLYFAMELVTGKTLAERIADGPLSVDAALAAIRAAALGVREAQRSGFTHRDLKPSNLMIDGHGEIKVLDFGLVAGAPEGVTAGPVAQTSLAGTPLYMAPEQARGEPIDFRADIYALGATLFHLVSGRPPFQADSVAELVTLHATAARPTLPRRGQPRTQIGAIDSLCAKMMASRPEDRFASYDELLRAIELASAVHTQPAGFWARSVATAIDFGFVAVVLGIVFALAGFVAGLFAGSLTITMDFTSLLPAFAAYQAIALSRWGRTFGKALLELEVVDVATSARPSFLRATYRALAMYGPPWLALWINDPAAGTGLRITNDVGGLLSALVSAIGILMLLYASARVAGKRALWDGIAGTMVRYRTSRASMSELPT